MKKMGMVFLTAAMLFLCCSCGLVRDLAGQAKDRLEQSVANQFFSLPDIAAEESLPALPTENPNQMTPEEGEEEQDTAAAEEFAQMADPESFISGERVARLDEIEQDMLYFYQADTGTYQKNVPFMGKAGSVELAFDLDGRNNYIDYCYTGELSTLNAQQVAREYEYLYRLAREKYGKVTIHTWLLNPTGIGDNFVNMGEFDEEEITDAVNENAVADFYYAWSRPGNSILYAYLLLESDGTYRVGFSYDRSNQFNFGKGGSL